MKRPQTGGQTEQGGRQRWGKRKKYGQTAAHTDHNFVLSGEVRRLTQQLALRHSDRAGGLSNQHSVVKPHTSQSWGNQVSALRACEDGQDGVKL